MSDIKEIINRIAIYAKENHESNLLSCWMQTYYSINNRSKPKQSVKELTLSDIKEILSYFYRDIPPKLSFEEIEVITKDYPFKLPLEIYELYSKGNGCLPIGLDTINSKNEITYDNYFYFPGGDEIGFKPLNECMQFYNSLAESKELYQTNFDLHWFPVAFFEDLILAVIGSKKQEITSPIISFYDCDLELGVDLQTRIEWSSVTNMLSAWIEVREQGLYNSGKENSSKIEAICRKYGAGFPKCAYFVS